MSLVSASDFEEVVKYLYCGNSSVGRAQPCQGWGREFESRFPLQIYCAVNSAHGVKRNLAKVGVVSLLQDASLVSRSKSGFIHKCIKTQEIVSRSSSGLGHCPFTAVTGVRVPYGMPYKVLRNLLK